MNNYVLSCCSTSDLSQQHYLQRDIRYVSFHYYLNDEEFRDDPSKPEILENFYQSMTDGATTRSSQVNADEFAEYFRPFLEKGLDILHVCLSSGLSGVYNSACIAKSVLEDQFPDREIRIVDSLGASSGYGLLLDMAADLRDAGKTLDEVASWIEANKKRVNHWFFSTDLTFYVRGGRISKAAGWFGTVLKICPLLNMDGKGRLIPREKIRGKRAVIDRIVAKMEENAELGLKYGGKCYISNSACLTDALLVKSMIEDRFPNLKGKVEINNVGTVIGAHTGPGTVALFFIGKERE